LLAKDPSARPPSASVVVDELAAQTGANRPIAQTTWSGSVRVAASAVPTTLSGAAATHLTPAPRAAVPRRSSRAFAIGAALVGATALALTALIVVTRRDPTGPARAAAPALPLSAPAASAATPPPPPPPPPPTREVVTAAPPELPAAAPPAKKRRRTAAKPQLAPRSSRGGGDIVVDDLTPPPPVRDVVVDELDRPTAPRR
jgi:hypothetical protein